MTSQWGGAHASEDALWRRRPHGLRDRLALRPLSPPPHLDLRRGESKGGRRLQARQRRRRGRRLPVMQQRGVLLRPQPRREGEEGGV